jgi:glutamate-1-semialdehyde 2,1-aminomutase
MGSKLIVCQHRRSRVCQCADHVGAPRTGEPAHSVAGEPASADVTVAVWHDLDALERAFSAGPPPAAVIMEPVPCNFGMVEPEPAYLTGVRRLCDDHGCLLIFDEVLTGFCLALGGALERFGGGEEPLAILPDLTVCSKAIASGFPIARLVGTIEAMRPLSDGRVGWRKRSTVLRCRWRRRSRSSGSCRLVAM